MADNNVVGGLFGITPEMFQQNRQAQQEAQALRMAQLAPEQLVTYLGARGGQNLGNVASNLLGIEDPQLKMVRDVQSMKGQFDVSTPAGLRQFAQALSAKGYTDLAMQAANQAASIGQKMGENINTLMGTGKYTPESLGKYTQTHNPADLVLIDTKLKGAETLLAGGKYTPASVAKFQKSQNPEDLILTKEALGAVAKPLPASLQKDEGKDLESYDTYIAQKEALTPSIDNLTPDAKGVRKLELGPFKNAKYAAQNASGNSTPESRAYEGLKSAVDTAVNLQVSAEKGVQTDKDVLRFANALIASYGRNDTQATLDALKRYNDSLDRAQQRVAGRIESRRKSQNVEPYFQGQQTTQETPTKKVVKFSDL
jgi:hypothetical protein